jgi:uncharacterized protein involved in exopolysaccharide biosynthesis
MLQTLTSGQSSAYVEREQGLDPARFIGIFRRRIFYFAIPFVLLLIVGCLVVSVQRPIYHAEGKILVESAQIPTTLVQPTVLAAAIERIQVLQQRIMTRDNLLSIINKFGLFPSEQRAMSGTQLLDLMRERASIQLVDIEGEMSTSKDGKSAPRPTSKNPAVAFTMGFDYEDPGVAAKVANEFLTLVLNEDVRARTNRAVETTQFLAREAKRVRTELDAVDAQIIEARRQIVAEAGTVKRPDGESDEGKAQKAALTTMKTDLVKYESVYSESHPAVKNLKRRIEALEKQLADEKKVAEDPASPQKHAMDTFALLSERHIALEKEFDEDDKKLTAARLGENMERDQQAEHLQVIEQPSVPQVPIRPKRLKLFAMAFALATMAGIGTLVAAEMFDKTLRGTADLAGVVDSHMLVVIPYITTPGELARKRHRIIALWVALLVFLLAGLAAAYYVGLEIQTSWFDRAWISSLTHLTK